MTTISIALATYNGERFLREQLESLARQSSLPDELVVADDGSTDRTLDIVRDFAATVPFKTVILPGEGRLGYRANFMRCAQHCTGDLIAFCDQDDIWDADKLAVVETSIRPTTLLIQHEFRVTNAEGKPLPGNMHELGIAVGGRWATVLGLTQVFRRSLLKYWPLWHLSIDHNDPTQPMAHDQWVYFLAELMSDVQSLDQPLLSYRQHGKNTCGINRHAITSQNLPLGDVLTEAVWGRLEKRKAKKELILDGLHRYQPAAAGRAKVITHLLTDFDIEALLFRLKNDLVFYSNLSTYFEYRMASYKAASTRSLGRSLMNCRRQYIKNGSRGLKDLLLDTLLNA